MIKKLSLSGFGLVATFILISAINKPTSSGAPSASTGGGGEQTCAMSTCHDDNSINNHNDDDYCYLCIYVNNR